MKTPVTALLSVALVAAYGLELASGGEASCEKYGLIPTQFVRHGALEPVFAAMFLHANLTHLVGNLIFLSVFGTVAEIELGSVRFAILYFASGIAGALLHVAVDPNASNAMVGCSGCVFGLMAFVATRQPRFLGFLIAFGSIEIWRAFSGDGSTISFGAHLGGLSAGVLCGIVMRLTEKERSAA